MRQDVSFAAFYDRLMGDGLSHAEDHAAQPSVGARRCRTRLRATLRPTLERLGYAERVTLSLAALLPADHLALPWIRVLVAQEHPELG